MIAFEKSVGAVVFRRDGGEIKYLIMQYRNGHWEFPRGKKEKGESDEQTMRREIREETGIKKLRIIPAFSENTYFFYAARNSERKERLKSGKGIYIFKKAQFFLAETDENEIQLSAEQLDAKWLGYEEAAGLVTYKNAKKILSKAGRFLETIKR